MYKNLCESCSRDVCEFNLMENTKRFNHCVIYAAKDKSQYKQYNYEIKVEIRSNDENYLFDEFIVDTNKFDKNTADYINDKFEVIMCGQFADKIEATFQEYKKESGCWNKGELWDEAKKYWLNNYYWQIVEMKMEEE